MSSAKWRPFCLGLHVLNRWSSHINAMSHSFYLHSGDQLISNLLEVNFIPDNIHFVRKSGY